MLTFKLPLSYRCKNITRRQLGHLKVLNWPLLQFGIRIPKIVVGLEDLLHQRFHFGEQITELDVCRQKKTPCRDAAQMEFWMEQFELDLGSWAFISSNEVSKLSEDVSTDFHHVLVASGALEGFENSFGGVPLHIFTVDDDLKNENLAGINSPRHIPG